MDQPQAESDYQGGFDLNSLIGFTSREQAEFDKTLSHALLAPDTPFTSTTVLSEFNNNTSGVVSSPASDTLNTPSPRSSPPPYFTIPANPPAVTTPSLNCTIPTDLNENVASTSTVIYPITNPTHISEGTYQVLTPVPTNQATYPDAATMPYLNTPQQGEITTTASTVQIPSAKKERSYAMASSTVIKEQYIPTMVAEYTPLQNSSSTFPSNTATSSSKRTNLAALSSRHNPILSKSSTLSKETCITLSLPVVNYPSSMECPAENVIAMEDYQTDEDYLNTLIVIDGENGTSKRMDLATILDECEIGNYPMMANEEENTIMSASYETMDVKIEKEDNKESIPQGIIQEAFKKTVKSNGRGRPVKTEGGPVAPKVDRKAAKFMDSKAVEAQRKQRKIDLNRDASKRYREEKKRKLEEKCMEIVGLATKNEQLKFKSSKMEMEILRYRKWCKLRGIEVESHMY